MNHETVVARIDSIINSTISSPYTRENHCRQALGMLEVLKMDFAPINFDEYERRIYNALEKAISEQREQQKYNGWTNRETWCVNLWLSNEQYTDSMINEQAEEVENERELADFIEEFVTGDEYNPVANDASLFSDLINSDLRSVNWVEIAEHYRPDDGWKFERESDDDLELDEIE